MAKKKTSQHQKQAAKERNNRQEKEFWIGFNNFMERLELKQHLSVLPKSVTSEIISHRISSIRLVPTKESSNTGCDTQELKDYFEDKFTRVCDVPYTNGATFTIKEYVIYLLYTAMIIKRYLENNRNEKVEGAFNGMVHFVEDNYLEFMNKMQACINLIAGWLSHPLKSYININIFDIRPNNSYNTLSDSQCSSLIFEYTSYVPTRRQVSIEGKRREVVEMAYSPWHGKMVWCTVAPSILKKTGDTPIRVFIQKHALNRLNERLDIVSENAQYNLTAQSIVEVKSVKQVGPNRYLLPASFNGFKLGYLVTNYVEDILVITTFLFITQEGSPEGILLSKLTGFKKLDKSYLCIDKMSTFIQSDIASKPELVKILQDAKLGHLIDLYQEIGYICEDQKENLDDPSFILEYIQKKQEEDMPSQTEMQEFDMMVVP